jgi:GNAT superfamily N-acetyltransferase
MDIIRVTDDGGRLVEPDWLGRAEAVHRQLRPQLPEGYSRKMQAIFASGGEMCIAVREGKVAGVAVFRCFENTHAGRKFYLDDLVTDEAARSSGVGHALLVFLEKLARDRGCSGMELDSGTQRRQAHKFYFREGFVISSFAFRKEFE